MDFQKESMLHPEYFYDHGTDPAFKELMFLISANSSSGKGIRQPQIMYEGKYRPRRIFMFINMEQFFINTCNASTIPTTLLVYSTIMMSSILGVRHARGFLPIGKYGISNFRQMNSFKVYGLAGVVLPISVMLASVYIGWRATVYTSQFMVNNIIYGERNYLKMYNTYSNEFGNYAFENHKFITKDFGKNMGKVLNELEEVKNEMEQEERTKYYREMIQRQNKN